MGANLTNGQFISKYCYMETTWFSPQPWHWLNCLWRVTRGFKGRRPLALFRKQEVTVELSFSSCFRKALCFPSTQALTWFFLSHGPTLQMLTLTGPPGSALLPSVIFQSCVLLFLSFTMKIAPYIKKNNLPELLLRIGKGVWVLLEALSQDIFPVPMPFHS